MRNPGAYLCVSLLLACSRSGGDDRSTTAATATAMPAASVAAASVAASTSSESGASTPSEPASLSANTTHDVAAPAAGGAQKESISGAVGLGCEATSNSGSLELLCRRRNGTGGHPVRAVIHMPLQPTRWGDAPSGPDEEVLPGDNGELKLTLPFGYGEHREVEMTWTDVRYTLKLDGTTGAFEWAGSAIPHRRACQALLDENHRTLAAAQKLEGAERLSAAELKGLNKLGTCQPAGLGSWALSLAHVSGAGEPTARSVKLELEVVRIDLDGKRTSGSFGTFEIAPGGFELGALVAYDYDDDGNDELIVPYEIKALLASAHDAPALAPIWSFSDSTITPYAKAPSIAGGFSVEHLDFDMRPDLGSYGPFVAYLGADCGAKACPPRLGGPRVFLHSLPDGGFSSNDDAVRAALKRTCSSKPAAIVVPVSGVPSLEKIAKNLVCARAHGVSTETLRAELAAKSSDVCSGAASCPLLTTLEAWSSAALPATLE